MEQKNRELPLVVDDFFKLNRNYRWSIIDSISTVLLDQDVRYIIIGEGIGNFFNPEIEVWKVIPYNGERDDPIKIPKKAIKTMFEEGRLIRIKNEMKVY